MSLDPTLEIFFEEASDLLRVFEEGVLGLEANPSDQDLLNAVFRAAHTLKGNSGMLGFERIAIFTHALEELLTRMRAGEVAATPGIVTTLLAASDILRALVTEAREGREGIIDGLDEVARALEAHVRGDAEAAPPGSAGAVGLSADGGSAGAIGLSADRRSAGATGLSADGGSAGAISGPPQMMVNRREHARSEGPRTLYEIRFTPKGEALRRGVNPAGILAALGDLGEMLRVETDPSSLPPLAEIEPDRTYVAFACWLMSQAPRAEIDACFEFVDEPGAVRIDALEMDDAAPAAPAGGGAPASTAAVPQVERRQGERRQGDRRQSEPSPAGAAARRGGAADADSQSIRVATDKVDGLVDLVGELVITQSMVAQLVEDFDPQSLPRLREAVAQMDRHSRELQERVMAVRMLPIKTVFGRFSRVVRDLAQSLGKRVQFETRGEETELDKTVIERISDPLTHLVRNAVDHGLETPEERRASGKPEVGRLTLSAYEQGGNIYIEIQEDGQGLDRDRILRKAMEQGLVGPGESLTDEQVHTLIFRPGFSTATRVTEVSGRGVGMDVVRRNVEALGGAIAIESARGRGTTFRIKLPLTLAILEGQLLRVGREVYVLPLVAITESVRPARETLSTVLDRGEAFVMRGTVLPLLRLHRIFDVPDAVQEPTLGLTVVVEADGRQAALLVDELLGQQQVVIKSLEANFEKVEGVSGATILGDGRVALILDVTGLVALACRRTEESRAA